MPRLAKQVGARQVILLHGVPGNIALPGSILTTNGFLYRSIKPIFAGLTFISQFFIYCDRHIQKPIT